MSLRACVVIPCYNHGRFIGATVDRLVSHGLPIVIVDDGSDNATAEVLRELAGRQPSVRLIRRPVNGGKGAAVMDGLRAADAAGYTHALQIDADGQHDTGDVPRFLAAGQQRPGTVIVGKPVYDASVPKVRLYGRYVTHIWVWIETLSFAIDDSMCGFRLYPLAAVMPLINRVRLSRRMNFDTEVLVRLVWSGVAIQNLPTRVIYPENGISHFRMLRDNLGLSATHARLVFGMLLRLPILLGRHVFARAR